MIGTIKGPVESIVPSSNVWTNRTVELIKKGCMFTVQTVLEGLTVGVTTDILFDPSAFIGEHVVVYEFFFDVTQGKGVTQFFAGGTYGDDGTPLFIGNRNENSLNTPVSLITFFNALFLTLLPHIAWVLQKVHLYGQPRAASK